MRLIPEEAITVDDTELWTSSTEPTLVPELCQSFTMSFTSTAQKQPQEEEIYANAKVLHGAILLSLKVFLAHLHMFVMSYFVCVVTRSTYTIYVLSSC